MSTAPAPYTRKFEKMLKHQMHPRIRERILKTKAGEAETELQTILNGRLVAQSGLKNLVVGLTMLEEGGVFPYGSLIVPQYEDLLRRIEALDPYRPGFEDELHSIAQSLELLSELTMDLMNNRPS